MNEVLIKYMQREMKLAQRKIWNKWFIWKKYIKE
jgi:hypothetical protein